MALREPVQSDPYRLGNRFQTDPKPEGISFRDDPVDAEEDSPRRWIPSRPFRKLPVAHSGSMGGPLDQQTTSRFLEGEIVAVTSKMGQTQARWDPDLQQLEIWFGDKAIGYTTVAWHEAQDYICARSKGEWWWDHIGMRGKGNQGKLKKMARNL